MFYVGYEIYTRELPCVYFITNIKHCITYLALTPSFHILKCTHYIAFAALRLGVSIFLVMDAFTWNKWILLAAFLLEFFQNYLENISLITRYRCIV